MAALRSARIRVHAHIAPGQAPGPAKALRVGGQRRAGTGGACHRPDKGPASAPWSAVSAVAPSARLLASVGGGGGVWMARWTDLHNPLRGAGYNLDPELHAHYMSRGVDRLLYYM